MTAELRDANRKLKRADSHLDDLERGVSSWVASDPYAFVQELDVERSAHLLRSRITEPYDEDWPLIVGESMGQARSALDHLVQQLAIKHRGSAKTCHSFPIYKTEEGFRGDKIGGIRARWKAEIRALQPYNASPPEVSPLFRLSSLTQTDKHREILVTAIALEPPSAAFEFRVGAIPSVEISALRVMAANWIGQPVDGSVIHGIATEPFDPDLRLEFEGRFPMAIAFGEGQETISDLRSLVRIVRKILTSFEPAFS